MQFLQKRIFLLVTTSSAFIFSACAPESKYNGGHGALHSYESAGAYGNSTIKYRSDYNQPTQSSFNSTLVANDRDNIRHTPQNMRQSGNAQNSSTQSGGTSSSTKSGKGVSGKGTSGKSSSAQTQGNLPANYESPVQGDSSFKPTQSLLGGMRDSEAIQRATMRPYTVRGKTYYPHPVKVGDTFDGIASWYGPDFHAKATSNGETYNMYAHTAAHKTLPMNTIVKVYNKDNGKTTVVRINDRGPFVEGRIIDLSNVAAHDIAMVGKGIANVRIEVVGFGGNLKNNTPPTDTPTNTQPARQESKQPQYRQPQQSTPPTKEAPSVTQEPVVLKPRHNQPQVVEETTYQPSHNAAPTQPTHTHTAPMQPSAPLEPEQNTMNPNTEPMENKEADSNKQAHQSQSNMNPNAPKQNYESKQSNESAQSTEPQDSMAFGESEDLPEVEPQKSAPNATLPEKKLRESKAQPNEEDALHSAFSNVTPKRIDNTEALKDIDEAMQKLKDSTDDLAQKAKEEAERRAKEEAQRAKAELESNVQSSNNTQPTETAPSMQESAKQPQEVAPAQEPAKQIAETTPNKDSAKQSSGNFMVSLNVFSQEERAKNFQNESQSFTQGTSYTIDIVPTDKGLYRVAIRGFQTYDEAKAFIAKHNITGHVVAESK